MRYKYLLSTIASLSILVQAGAVEIDTQAGELADKLSDPGITALTVTGSLNAADFEAISSLEKLSTLDLSNVSIVEYNGPTVLTSVTASDKDAIPAYAFMGMSRLVSVKLPATTTRIGEAAFAASGIREIEIPRSVTTIGSGAFNACRQLSSITIPASVTQLGEHCFSGCDNLTQASVTAKLPTLPESTFARCPALESVTLSTSVIEIGQSAFAGCTSLTQIQLPASLSVIAPRAFEQSGLREMELSNATSLDSIGDWAFAKCGQLTAVYLNNRITRMGEGVFFDDARLSQYSTPTSVTVIAPYSLKGTSALSTTGILPEGITRIGDYALTGWNRATEVTLPSTMEYIGNNAFEGWTSLASVDATSLSTVPLLGDNVWLGVDRPSVLLDTKPSMITAFSNAEQWKEFKISNTSSLEESMNDDGERIKAYFSGYELIIQSPDTISSIRLYDTAGRQLAHVEPDDTNASIDTYGMSPNIYIAQITLADGSSQAVKVARTNR